MSESIALPSNVDLSMDRLEKPTPKLPLANNSSSFEKVVSACTGAVITMSFSKQPLILCKAIFYSFIFV